MQLRLLDLPEVSCQAPPEAWPPLRYGVDLSQQQAGVRDARGTNLVVVAGAGTGKTETLTQRVVALLMPPAGQGAPLELDRVLALTFTDKAAAEMRERIYERLVAMLRGLDHTDPRRARLLALRSEFAEKHAILTFDAFNRRILTRHANLAPLRPDVALLDAAAELRARRAVSRRFWNRIEARPDLQTPLWHLIEYLGSPGETISRLIELARESGPGELEFWAEPSESDARRELDERIDALWHQRLEDQASALEGDLQTIRESLQALVEPLPGELRDLLNDEARAAGLVTARQEWNKIALKKHPGLQAHDELCRELSRLKTALAQLQSARQATDQPLGHARFEREQKARAALSTLAQHALWWRDERHDWCQEHGVAAFADIARAALQTLEHPQAAQRERERFDAILVDEFQDTNEAQWRLLDLIRRPNQEDSGGNVLIVGDQKQAIYGFRGGDITVFDRVRRLLLGSAKAHELTISRRSTPALVEWSNATFARLFPPPETRAAFEASPQNLQAAADADFPSHVWWMRSRDWLTHSEQAQSETGAAQATRGAAQATARLLRLLCDDALQWREAGARGEKEGGDLARTTPDGLTLPAMARISRLIARGEPAIALLYPSHQAKAIGEVALSEVDVPFESLGGRGFWSCDAASWSAHLLRFCLDATDEWAFCALARSPLGGLSDRALLEWRLARDASNPNTNTHPEATNSEATNTKGANFEGMDAPEVELCVEVGCHHVEFEPSLPADRAAWPVFAARLERWRCAARVLAPSQVLRQAHRESEVVFFEAHLDDFAQREANWIKLFGLLESAQQGGSIGLRSQIDFLEAMRELGGNEALAAPPSDGSIQLLTMHAAKGLEWPMVMLCDLAHRGQNPTSKRLLRGDLLIEANEPDQSPERLRIWALQETEPEHVILKDREEENSRPREHVLLDKQETAFRRAEWMRLLYVACTRAREHLVLEWAANAEHAGDSGDGTPAFAAWLRDSLGNDPAPGEQQASHLARPLRPSGGSEWIEEFAARSSLVSRDTSRWTRRAPDLDCLPPPPPPVPRAAQSVVRLDEQAGRRSEEISEFAARRWFERQIEPLGISAADIRANTPWLLCLHSGELPTPENPHAMRLASQVELHGEWELLALRGPNEVLVCATGTAESAPQRLAWMLRAARAQGATNARGWALWQQNGELRAKPSQDADPSANPTPDS